MRSLLFLALLLFEGTQTPSAETPAEAQKKVVVELFTSEGCSSCPPADRFLSELGAEPGVIALSFHVDYWNHLGWRDPFSSSQWSLRQQRYARAFGTNRSYTPMMVVDGALDLVGSDRARVREVIAQRRERAYEAEVTLEASRRDDVIEARIAATPLTDLPGSAVFLVLVYEKRLSVKVERGENARRTLLHDYVVRDSRTATWSQAPCSQAPCSHAQTVELRVQPDWSPDELGVAVLLQSPRSQKIFGAAAADLIKVAEATEQFDPFR